MNYLWRFILKYKYFMGLLLMIFIIFIVLIYFEAKPGTQVDFGNIKITKPSEKIYYVRASSFSGNFILNAGVESDKIIRNFWIDIELTKVSLPKPMIALHAQDILLGCWKNSKCANGSTEWFGKAISDNKSWETIDSNYKRDMEEWYEKARKIIGSDATTEIPIASIGSLLENGSNTLKFNITPLQDDWWLTIDVLEGGANNATNLPLATATISPANSVKDNKNKKPEFLFQVPIFVK